MGTSRRGRLLILAAILLALSIIGLRAADGHRQQLETLRVALQQGSVHAAQFSEAVRDRLTTARLVAETYLDDQAVAIPPEARGWLPADGFGRFREPNVPATPLLEGATATPTHSFRQEVEAALALSPLFQVIVDSDPYLMRAFYASLRGFANTYPWWPGGMTDLEAGYLDLTLFDLGRPQINPLREPYWLAPVQREQGGLFATMAAPVYHGDHFAAVVGLHVSLDGARYVLDALDLPFGTIFLVDRQLDVIAAAGPGADDRGFLSVDPSDIERPVRGRRATLLMSLNAREFHFVDGSLVYRLPLRELPLSLVYRASFDEFALAVAPPVADTLAIVGFVAVVAWLLRERAGAMQARRESEELFRVLVETAPVGLALTRIETGEIVALNPVASDLLDVKPDMANRYRATSFYADPEDRDRMLEEVRTNGSAIDFQVQFKSVAGRVFWSQICGTPTQYRGETVLLTSVVDVTARKLAEQRVRLSEERHRAIFSTASVGIALMDATGRFLQVNQAWCDMLGYLPDEAGGMTHCDVVHPEERDRACGSLRRLLANGTGGLRQEIRFIRRNDSVVWGDFTASIVRQADGTVEGVVGVILDITARRAYEAELVATRRRLEDQAAELRRTARHLSIARRDSERALMVAEQANQAKSHFLAAMSHELRTPLNAILGFSELIRDQALGPGDGAFARYSEYAADVHDSGSYLLDLINDILDISKIEAGKIEIDRAEVDLRALLEGVLRLVKVRADGGGLTLDLDVDDRAAFIIADERALKQIAFNLVSNAIKFTPSGGRILVCAVADEERIDLSVIDSGIGIPPEALDQVTHPFEQLDNRFDRRSPFGGTGLGLSLVRALTELHGGDVRIESTVNVGTKVTVSLPRLCIPQTMADPAHRWTARVVG